MKHKTGRKLLRFLLTLALVMGVMLPNVVARAAAGSKITIVEEPSYEQVGSDFNLIVTTTVRDVNDNPINKGRVQV